MTHLLSISLGPVQEFIAAGRRTNDLYAGSALISEIAKAAAEAVKEAGGELIFPADPTDGAANKILVAVSEPKKIAEAAEAAAKRHLQDAWNAACGKLAGQQAHIDHDIAEQQINAFLEFYAAWWPWDGQDGDSYVKARKSVELLLAGRKALRDFKQPPKNPGRYKSPLDPSRDTVINRLEVQRPYADENGNPGVTYMPEACTKAPLWLKNSEWLDAVSVLKRVLGARDQEGKKRAAPSTSDIAAKTFLARDPDLRKRLEQENIPLGAVFKSRRTELQSEGEITKEQAEWIAHEVGRREPDPYFAILVADGDRIGQHLSSVSTVEKHREFSRLLAGFAKRAEALVQEHEGHPVYSGGDDVLAFLPTHRALACAESLAAEFNRLTGCTLSVGLAVCHYHEPLYSSRANAHDALEKKAKDAGGDRLCLAVHTRGGEPRTAVCKWGDALAQWREWIAAFNGGLARGFPYELVDLARETENSGLAPETLRAESARIFARKKEGAPQDRLPDYAAKEFGPEGRVQTPKDMRELADRLIILQWMARKEADG